MKRNLLKAIGATFMAVAMALSMVPAVPAQAADANITEVVVNTTTKPAGQNLDSITITVKDKKAAKLLTAEDFTISGTAAGWLTSATHPWTADITNVSLHGNCEVTLEVSNFIEKYVYVRSFEVSCSNEKFSFTMDDVDQVITPIADEFTDIASGTQEFKLYSPKQTNKKPLPLVVAFHGLGDEATLYQNQVATAWADPANQKTRKAYVLAPMVPGYNYMSAAVRENLYVETMAVIENLIAEGKVDPNRVYVTGKSFGGLATVEFCEKYTDQIAGAIAMCAYIRGVANNAFTNAYVMKDLPIWLAQATNDSTSPIINSRTVYANLIEAGSTVAKFTEYSNEEMDAAFAAHGTSVEIVGYHGVEIPVLTNTDYMTWLFAQNLADRQ